jgi:hypothetical protein
MREAEGRHEFLLCRGLRPLPKHKALPAKNVCWKHSKTEASHSVEWILELPQPCSVLPLFTSSIIGCMEILFLILAATIFGLGTQYVIVHIKIGWRKRASLAKQKVWPSNFAQFAEVVHLLEKSVTNMIWLPLLVYDWWSRWFGIRSLPSIWSLSFSYMGVS